jgi:hypothetical protein
LSTDRPTREEALDDLFLEDDASSALTEEDAMAMSAAFDALDGAPEVRLADERRDALREMLALDFAPEFADPTVVKAAQGVEALPRETLMTGETKRLLEAVMRRVSAFTRGDEWAWIAASITSFLVVVGLTGVRQTPAGAATDPMVLVPTLFLVVTGAIGMRLTRRWGNGALYGALMAGIAAMALGAIGAGGPEAFQSSESVGNWIQFGVPCLGLGTATALFAALPFVLIRRGVSVRDGAKLGAMGAITGAGVLHAHCPISMLDHILWHGLAIAAAAAIGAIIVLGQQRLLGVHAD